MDNWNNEVMSNIAGVILAITYALEDKPDKN